jgi:Uma2 family endonuclease
VVDLKNLQLKVFRDLVNHNYQSELTLKTGQISPLFFPQINIEVEKIIN